MTDSNNTVNQEPEKEKEGETPIIHPQEEKKEETSRPGKDASLKKKEKKPKSMTFPIIMVVSISLLVGGGGGFLFYRMNHPLTSALSASGFEGHVPTDSEVKDQIADGSIVTSFKDKAYQMINYTLARQASYPYSLTIGKASVLSSGVTQSVVSTTYTTPKEIYNQNISSSAFVKTANRFYDSLNGKVSCYLKNTPDQWAKGDPSVDYTYDEYMQHYGKLLQGSYYCITSSEKPTEAMPISDRYLSSDVKDYQASTEKSKHHVNGVVIYQIGPTSVKASTIEKKDDGYFLTVDLYTDSDRQKNTDSSKKISTGNSYYSVQMRSTGGLASRPSFSLSHLEFTVDSNFDLVSSYFRDEYTAVVGPINSPATSDMDQYYFHSDTDTLNGVKVTIPEPTSTEEFAGYQLFPKESQ